jgi:hypothetical protein
MGERPPRLEEQRDPENEAEQEKGISDAAPIFMPRHPGKEGKNEADVQDEGEGQSRRYATVPSNVRFEVR